MASACRDAKFCVSRARDAFIDSKLLQACIAMGCLWDAKFCVSTGLTPLRILGMYHWLYALFIKVETQNLASHKQGMHLLAANYCRYVLLWAAREARGMHLSAANYCRHVLLWVDRETQNFASLLWFDSGGRAECWCFRTKWRLRHPQWFCIQKKAGWEQWLSHAA